MSGPEFDPITNDQNDRSQDSKRLRKEILDKVESYFLSVKKERQFVPGRTYLPASQKVLDASDVQYLISAGLDTWLTSGRFNDAFEDRFASTMGTKYALTANSGSSANLLAITALTSRKLGNDRLRKGDEVVTVAAGFPTTVGPIVQNGLVPVFVDVDLPTYNINTDAVKEAIGERTRAIFVAHTLGNPFDLGPLRRLCSDRSLWLIEDCCDALGSRYEGKQVGSWGDIGTFSFYPAHHITMGEGGATVTNDDRLATLMESFRDWGRDCRCPPGRENVCGNRFGQKFGQLPDGYDHKYVYSHLGYNLKITDMQASVGLSQLRKLPEFIKKRRDNFSRLWDGLRDLEGEIMLPQATAGSDPSWFGFPITVEVGADGQSRRRRLIEHLDDGRIGTRLLFAGNMTKQPCMEGIDHRVVGELANTDQIMYDSFWVGVHPGLDDEMLDYMVAKIKTFFH
ncbi:MAG: lipopolysaccharide biosynthesis protein RfbH [Methanomassiliicoccus sp.]|nr:lipopolysaccharide biosynthesis protein RfbH [Methanomassiliicoccus sp.]